MTCSVRQNCFSPRDCGREKLKIAHVISGLSPENGGLSIAALETARWQNLLGHDCTILTGDDRRLTYSSDLLSDFLQAGGSLIKFRTFGPQKIRYMPQLRHYLESNGREFDLYVLHGSYQYPAYAAARFCQIGGIPYIFTPHGSLDPAVRTKHHFRNRIIDFTYHDDVIRNANALHFTSEDERAACERKIWRDSFVEPLGIDIERIPKGGESGRFRAKYGIPNDATLLLFLSRITRKKGIDILLESFKRLAADLPGVYLALCGPIDGDMSGLVDAALREPSIARRLVATGLILGEDKHAAFLDCDFFVLPTYSENFGIAVFEALAYGAPVVTTTGMNWHEELSNCGRALIVEPNADTLYDGLFRAISRNWQPTATAEDARSWLARNFSWELRAANLLHHYEQAMRS